MADGNGSNGIKTHWLVESLGGLNIVGFIGILLAGFWQFANLQSDQRQMAGDLEGIKQRLDRSQSLMVEMATLKVTLDNIINQQSRLESQFGSFQSTFHDLRSQIREMDRPAR